MFKDYPLLKDKKNSITQFYPHIPKNSLIALKKVFSGRWVGQGPLVDKLESFGWFVVETDGHDHRDLLKAFKNDSPSKPKVVIAHTTKGKGVSFMEDRVQWHYKNPNDKELKEALMELNEK